MANTSATAPVAASPAAPSPTADGAAPASVNVTEKVTSTPAADAKPSAPAKVKLSKGEFSVEELEAALSTHSTVDEAMKSLSSKQKDIEAREAAFKSGDRAKIMKALRDAGVPKDQLAEMAAEILTAEIEDDKLSPAEKELRELKAEKAAREAELEAQKEAEKAKALDAQTAQLAEAYEAQFIEAMSGQGLPKTTKTLSELVQIVQDGLEAGYEISPAEAATLLRARTTEAYKPVLEGMSVEQLKAALPAKVIEALIKDYTEGLRASASKVPDAPSRRGPAAPRANKPMTLDEIIAAKQGAPRRR